ncbi:hypothetical protein ACFL3N_01190 [Candidatus Omnitrophota bacterium]
MKRSFVNISLVCISTLSMLFFTEIILRNFYPQRLASHFPNLHIVDEDVGYVMRPGHQTRASGYEYDHPISINSMGLRDKEYEREKEKGVYRIIVLGDSFIFNIGTPYGKGVTEVLEKKLNDNISQFKNIKRFEVINAGICGTFPFQQLQFYKKYLRRLDANMVVFAFFEGNDYRKWGEDFADVEVFRSLRFDPKTLSGWLYPINELLECRSHLYMFIRNRLEALRFSLGLTDHHIWDIYLRKCSYLVKENEKVFEQIAAEFRSGPELLVFNIPDRLAVDQEYRESILRIKKTSKNDIDVLAPRTYFKETMDDNNINNYVDLSEHFAGNDPESLYFPIDGHWNEKGNALAADILYPIIINVAAKSDL